MTKERIIREHVRDRDYLGTFIIGLCLLIGPTIAVGVYKLLESMEQATKQVVAGMVLATVFYVVATLCLSLFVAVYSKLRRTEEHEDDYREMALIDRVRGTSDKPSPVTVQVASGQPTVGNYPQQYAPPQLDFQNGGVDIG